MEHESGNGSKESHEQSEDEHKHPLTHMLHTPLMQALQPTWISINDRLHQ